MGKNKPDVLQGTLDLLVLKTLARGTLHGYGIANMIQRISADALRVEEGSLYPALHRIEQEGWIKSEWGLSEKNRKAKFYSITAAGRKQLAREEKEWDKLTAAVATVLRFSEGS
jgi:PadR family transcriptional regulator, regulatory protein PadR